MRPVVLTALVALAACSDEPGSDFVVELASPAPVVEGAVVSFRALGLPPETALAWDFGDGVARTGAMEETHVFQQDGDYVVIVGAGDFGEGHVDVHVDNAAPVLFVNGRDDWLPDVPYSIAGRIDDPGITDAHTATVDWGDGSVETLEPEGGVLDTWHAFDAGSFTVRVTVADDAGATAEQTIPLEVSDHTVIEIDAELPAWTVVGRAIVGHVRASAIPAADVTLAVAGGPSGAVLDATGGIRFTPAAADVGAHDIVIEATSGTTTETTTLHVDVSATTAVASATISASSGGVVEVTDSASPLFGARLEVPPGALAMDQEISLSLVDAAPVGASPAAGPAVEIAPDGLAFAIPATLRLPFRVADVPADAEVAIETFIPVHPHGGSFWTEAAVPIAPPADGFAVAILAHASSYRVDVYRRGERVEYQTPHFAIWYYVDGLDAPPRAYQNAARPDGYRPDVPTFVQDLGDFLERSWDAYSLSYFVKPERTQVLVARIPEPPGSAIRGSALWDSWDQSLPQIRFNGARLPRAATLEFTAAHEMFHTVQFRSIAPGDPAAQVVGAVVVVGMGAKWLLEASASSKAVEVFPDNPGNGHATAIYLYSSDIVGPRGVGYEAFPLFLYANAHYAEDLALRLFGVVAGHDPEVRTIAEPGEDYLYRTFEENLEETHPFVFWTDFALGYQATYDEAFFPSIGAWLASELARLRTAGLLSTNRLTGREREAPMGTELPPKALLVRLERRRTRVELGRGQIATSVVAPVCVAGEDCAAMLATFPSASEFTLAVRAVAGADPDGTRFAVFVFDPEDPSDLTRVGVFAPSAVADVPLALFMEKPTRQIAVSFVHAPDAAADTSTAGAEVFFRPAEPGRCEKVAIVSGQYAYAVIDGDVFTWGATSATPTRIAGLPGPARCVAEGRLDATAVTSRLAAQILLDDRRLYSHDPATGAVAEVSTDVVTIAMDVFVRQDGTNWHRGPWGDMGPCTDYACPTASYCEYAHDCKIVTPHAVPTEILGGLRDVLQIQHNQYNSFAYVSSFLARDRAGRALWAGQNMRGFAGNGMLWEGPISYYEPYAPSQPPRPVDLPGRVLDVATGGLLGTVSLAVVQSASGREVWGWGGEVVSGGGLLNELPTCPAHTSMDVCPAGIAAVLCSSDTIYSRAICEGGSFTCDCACDPQCCHDGSFTCTTIDCTSFDPPTLHRRVSGPAYLPRTIHGIPSPVRIAALDGARRIFRQHAIMSDGTVMAWGESLAGERGDGTSGISFGQPAACTVSPVTLPVGVDSIATALEQTTLFHVFDGTSDSVWATGSNAANLLGRAGGSVTTPIRVAIP